MSLDFTRARIGAFALLVCGFAAWVELATPRMTGSWQPLGYCMLLFTVGTFLLCFVDFHYGSFPVKSLKPLIKAGGAALMILAATLVYSLQHSRSLSRITSNHAMELTAARTVFTFLDD